MRSSRIDVTATYPLLKGRALTLPQRSPYYNLEPIDVETPSIESLTSYTTRLAAAHSVSVGTLYEFTIVPALDKPYLVAPPHLGPASTLLGSFRNQLKNINGVGKIAGEWVGVLENMTLRNNLKYLTFLPLSEALTHFKLLKRTQSWCPVCYEEMHRTSGVIYQPLVWSIKLVQICDRHQVRLADKCPQCESRFLSLTRRFKVGFCPRCYCWLGGEVNESAESLFTAGELEWQLFICDNLRELIIEAQKESFLVSKANISRWLQICATKVTGGKVQRLSALIGKPNLTVHEWYHGNVKPVLFDLFRICYCLDLRLVQLLTGNGIGEKEIFRTRLFPKEVEPVGRIRTPKPFDDLKVKKLLTKYLKVSPPLSMRKVSVEIGHNHGTLYKKFPNLCLQISRRYQEFLQVRYKERQNEREDEVRQACSELYKRDIYLSARSVTEYLNKPSYLGRRDVAAIIKKVRKELGQTKK
jgi:hypothetical protein